MTLKNAILTSLAAGGIMLAVPVALGNTYGFTDSDEDATTSSTVQEDSPEWSCVDDGNHVCGPDNPEHVPPGHYDDGGVLDIPWSQMTIA